jgi:hypothetical protein
MRKIGAIVLLYAFMLSYFGVGSVRNAISEASLPEAGRLLALLFGLSWIAYFVGGVLLLIPRASGMAVARTAAIAAGTVNVAGVVLFWSSEQDLHGLIFTLTRPLFDLLLVLALPALAKAPRPTISLPVQRWIATCLGGALLPWIAALDVRAAQGGQLVLSRPLNVFGTLFLSFWSTLPYVVLLLLTSILWTRRAMLFGGLLGTTIASMYTYGLIWTQGYNNFLLALLPPVVFGGQTVGLFVVWATERSRSA